jgi:adenylate cyclase
MNPENLRKLPGEPETAAASSGQPRLIRFDRYMLDLRRGTLRSGEDDIEIRPKTFEVLKLLVENAGRLVSKDEIVAAVWPGVFVTDDSVVQCVKELRRALGPDGERLVRTVPRRGYRLEADGPTDLAATPPDSDARRVDGQPGSTAGVAADGRLAGLDAADMQRVTAIAAENKLILPSFVINRPAANVSPQLRRYSGIWASKIAFNGTGRHAMLVVTNVEGDGTIMGYYVYGPPTPQTPEQHPAGVVQWLGKVSDGALTYRFPLGTTMTVQFTGDNIFLVLNRTDGFRPTVTMEPVWRLADEERAAERRALGPDGERLVRTVPRRGYRLEAGGLTDLAATPPDSDARRADGQPGSMAGAAPRRSHDRLGLAVAAGFAALLAICLFPELIIPRALPQGGKPAIAVLPFASAGEDVDHFADGMTHDMINALGRFSSLTVMSHSAVVLYKHRSATPQQVGRALSVRYVLEGSVRRLGDRLRVTAVLADTDRGQVLWSGRFDETPDGVFDVQDRITTEVVGSLAVKVTQVELQRAHRKPAGSLEAYDYVLRARRAMSELKRTANVDARALLRKAIELDPHDAAAYTALGETYRVAVFMGWEQSPDAALKEADALAHKALSLSDEDVRAHSLLGLIQMCYGHYEQALAELDRATAINPNDADAVAGRGTVLVWSGRTEEGIRELEAAGRIDPAFLHRFALGLAYYLTGKYDAAIGLLSRNLSETPDAWHDGAVLAASYAQQGRSEEAARAVALVRRFDPAFEVGAFGRHLQKPADRERVHEGLRKAGL